jgi:hypothetical protein
MESLIVYVEVARIKSCLIDCEQIFYRMLPRAPHEQNQVMPRSRSLASNQSP